MDAYLPRWLSHTITSSRLPSNAMVAMSRWVRSGRPGSGNHGRFPRKGRQIHPKLSWHSAKNEARKKKTWWQLTQGFSHLFASIEALRELLSVSEGSELTIGAKDRSSTTTFNFSIVSSNSFTSKWRWDPKEIPSIWSNKNRVTQIHHNTDHHWSMPLCCYATIIWNSLHPMDASIFTNQD